MPKYFYQCDKCKISFEIVHSIKEKLHDCVDCNVSGSLSRLPYAPLTFKTHDKGAPAGELVKRFIKENQQETKQQKKEYKEEYKGGK